MQDESFEDDDILLEDVISRVAFAAGVESDDTSVARVLKVGRSSPATWRKRGTLPLGPLVKWAVRAGISLDWLLVSGPSARSLYSSNAFSSFYLDEDLMRASERSEQHRAKMLAGAFVRPHLSGELSGGLPLNGGEFSLVPVYDVRVSAGGGAVNGEENVKSSLAFRTEWLRYELRREPGDLVVVEATGDSMAPTISSGDTLLVDKKDTQMADGMYVLAIEDRVLVKRVQILADGSVRLRSDNPVYVPEELRDQEIERLQIVGRVVWIGRRI